MAKCRDMGLDLTVVVYFLVSIWCVRGGYLTESYVKIYKYYNDIPSTIFYGLLTDGADIEKIDLINGSCLQYDPHQFDRCTYYGDCCPFVPVRVKKQLPMGTFSCHNGFYIVDKCPHGTDVELKRKCETASASGLDLEAWPVSSTTTQLAYKNVYCAMCHGLNPVAKNDFNRTFHSQNQTETLTVEWWATKIECDLNSIKIYLENRPDHGKLMQFIQRSCQVYYIPPMVPDLCWEAVRFCSKDADDELTRLCEQGPVNYMLDSSTGERYRNQFCAMCQLNKKSTDLSSMVPLESLNQTDAKRNTSLEFRLHFNTLKLSTDDPLTVLAVVKLTLSEHTIALSQNQRSSFQASNEFRCRTFIDESLNFCNINPIEQRQGQEHLGWNLGSLLCQSSFGKVCDVLAIKREDSADCDFLGCKPDSIPDITANECQYMATSPIQTATHADEVLTWQSSKVCDYYSKCRAVELGLITESELNCYCDKFCRFFNDCCEDSNYQPTTSTKLEPGTYSCQLQDGYNRRFAHRIWGLMVVNKCPSSYKLKPNFNETVKQHCEGVHYGSGYSLDRLPVTDKLTEIVYRNIYCAICNGVEDVLYWRVDMGAVRVANDSCHHHIRSWLNSEKIKQLRWNPSVQILKNSWWNVKQYLPPLTQEFYRKCSSMGDKYVETCPDAMNNTKYAELCSQGPASLVYEAVDAAQFIKQNIVFFDGMGVQNYYAGESKTRYIEFKPQTIYRNSFCATCHDALVVGCQVKNFKVLDGNATFQSYVSSPKLYLLVYRIDLNQRTCERLSDGRAVYGVAETGWDTCLSITRSLRTCNDTEVYNLGTERCEPLLVPTQHPTTIEQSIPQTACAGEEFEASLLPLNAALTKCNECSENRTCQVIPIASTSNLSLTSPSIHCAATVSEILPPYCKRFQSEECATSLNFGGLSGSYIRSEGYLSSIKSDNFISIRYLQVEHRLSIKHPEVNTLGQLFSVSQTSNQPVCLKYGSLDRNPNDSKYLVCNNGSAAKLDRTQAYQDFQLKGYKLEMCVEYVGPGLHLAVYDYIITAISILVGLIYVIQSVVKLEHKKTSSYVAISTLLAVIGSLICYCFINVSDDPTGCMVIAVLCQYFFLSIHTWSNAWAVMLVKGILIISARPKKQSKLAYSLYAWLTPLLLVTLSLALHYTKAQTFYPVFTEHVCFIAPGPVRALVFTGPIYTLILANLVICVVISYKVLRSGRNVKTTDKKRTKKRILTILKLQAILGFHWILLYFAEIPGSQQKWLWEVLTIVISLQGVLLVSAQLINLDNISKFSIMVRSSMKTITTSSGSYKLSRASKPNSTKSQKSTESAKKSAGFNLNVFGLHTHNVDS